MFKMKLGAKIASGFTLVLAILAILGILSIVEMRIVNSKTVQLVEEHIPEVQIANHMEVYFLEALYEMRAFEYSREVKFLDAANKHLHHLDGAIGEAETLISSAPHLQSLQSSIAKIKEDTLQFEAMIVETKKMTTTFEEKYAALVEYGGKYMESTNSFLLDQELKLEKLIEHQAPAAEQLEHLKEIEEATAMLNLGHLARQHVLRAMAVREQKYLDEAEATFAKAIHEVEKLQRITRSEAALRMIAPIKQYAEHYLNDLKQLHHAWNEMERLAEARRDLGKVLLKETIEIAESGIASTIAIGRETEETLHGAMNIISAGLVVAILLGVTISVVLTRSLTRPIRKSVELAQEIAKGDFSVRLNLKRSDEIGDLSNSLDAMSDSLQKAADLAETIADGNLDVEVSLASEKDQLGQALKKMAESLNDMLGQIQVAGEQIASGSSQVSDSSQSLSQGATEQASSLEEISASLNQMSAQTTTNAENANQANRLASEAQSAAQNGSRQMTAMVEAMTEINEAGQNISKIIKTIDEIAFQTNLLALNAAVEAARAGQHGKGFAVVAEEVRNLAARSAKAAEETAVLIEGSVEKTENGSAIANQTAEALQEIVGGVGKVNDLIAEIAAASNEQAQGVAQINQGVSQIDQVTQQNTASAEECAAASEELSGQAEQMRQMLLRFTLKQGSQTQHPTSPALPRAQSKVSWSQMNQEQQNTSAKQPQIALDDSDFGKY